MFYSLVYINSLFGSNNLKYLYSVISVKLHLLPMEESLIRREIDLFVDRLSLISLTPIQHH